MGPRNVIWRALVQVWRQTLLGWFLLVAGFAVVAVGLCYLTVREQLFDPWPVTVLTIVTAICVGFSGGKGR